MVANQQPQSPLFRLPAELRNRIYEQASIIHGANDEAGIFRTCRQIRNEGLKLFYATHAFSFVVKGGSRMRWQAKEYQHFLTCIGAEKAAMIEHLHFDIFNETGRTSGRNTAGVVVEVTLDPEKVQVVDASLSRGNIVQRQVQALERARVDLNSTWGGHGNPTKAGLLRTVVILVPMGVELGDGVQQCYARGPR